MDRAGNVYIADSLNYRVRKVTVATGIITTIAGNGFASPTVTDEIPALSAEMDNPNGVAVDPSGNVYISESNRIRKVDSSGTIHIQLGHAQVRIEGNADPVLLRVLLKCLRR